MLEVGFLTRLATYSCGTVLDLHQLPPLHPDIRASGYLNFQLCLNPNISKLGSQDAGKPSHLKGSNAGECLDMLYNCAMKKTSLRRMSEKNLARLQSLQLGNDCAIHAISAAIELLTEVRLDPHELIEEVNRIWWHGRFYRLAPKQGIPPPIQVRLVKYLAKTRNLPVHAQLLHLNPEVLRVTAEADNIASLITIYWWFKQAPPIYYKDQDRNYNRLEGASGHTMLFAAYDPDHLSGNIPTPWGFINSWVTEGSGLFWMTDADFRRAWNLPLPRWGNNATVVLSLKID